MPGRVQAATFPATGTLDGLGAEIAAAPDAQVLRIVAMVDGLAARGPADSVVEMLRPRLRLLRPGRRLRVARLLFLPADPVIVPAADARPGGVRLPRPAVAELGRLLLAALGDRAAAAQAALDRATRIEEVVRVGESLWPVAAAWLRTAPVPPRWTERRLAPDRFTDLAAAVAGLLASGADLVRLQLGLGGGMTPALLARMFRRAGPPDGPGAILLLAVLLRIAPDSADLARYLGETARRGAPAGAALIEAQIAALEDAPAPPRAELPGAAAALRRQAALLDLLQAELPDTGQRRRVAAARAQLSLAAAQAFATSVRTGIDAVLSPGRDLSDTALDSLERQARSLRRFAAQAAAGLGDGPLYQAALAGASVNVRASALPLMDRARLIEILEGAQAALAWLEETGAPLQ